MRQNETILDDLDALNCFRDTLDIILWRKILTLCRFGRSHENVSGSRKLSRNVRFEAGSSYFHEISQNTTKLLEIVRF